MKIIRLLMIKDINSDDDAADDDGVVVFDDNTLDTEFIFCMTNSALKGCNQNFKQNSIYSIQGGRVYKHLDFPYRLFE